MSARYTMLLILSLGLAAGRGPGLLDNGLARTPPMGWNSWNHFGCDVSAQLIKETADAMARSGMRDAGYQRSEERRVGKECRSRWSPEHEKKKEWYGVEEMET